jgi:hypothetical protein
MIMEVSKDIVLRLQGRNAPEDERMCSSKMKIINLHGIITQITTK